MNTLKISKEQFQVDSIAYFFLNSQWQGDLSMQWHKLRDTNLSGRFRYLRTYYFGAEFYGILEFDSLLIQLYDTTCVSPQRIVVEYSKFWHDTVLTPVTGLSLWVLISHTFLWIILDKSFHIFCYSPSRNVYFCRIYRKSSLFGIIYAPAFIYWPHYVQRSYTSYERSTELLDSFFLDTFVSVNAIVPQMSVRSIFFASFFTHPLWLPHWFYYSAD